MAAVTATVETNGRRCEHRVGHAESVEELAVKPSTFHALFRDSYSATCLCPLPMFIIPLTLPPYIHIYIYS